MRGEEGRHAVLCVNWPDRDYVRKFVEEICTMFNSEGIRFASFHSNPPWIRTDNPETVFQMRRLCSIGGRPVSVVDGFRYVLPTDSGRPRIVWCAGDW